jgi:hypothetical protein
VAILVGYLITNPLDYGTIGFLAFILVLLISPVFIKWHYPIMVFSLGSPIILFFLPGKPPLVQVAVLMCLGISIVERTLNSSRRFVSVPSVTWPLLFIFAVVLITEKLTGGIGLHSLGGDVGGGKKYIALFCGIATYFAVTSQAISPARRNWYVGLFFLSGILSTLSDLFPFLPAPLNYINFLIPPSSFTTSGTETTVGLTRLGSFAYAAACIINFMLARYGVRGIFLSGRPGRILLLFILLIITLFGGFRTTLISILCIMAGMFFLEKLHRTRLLPIFAFAGIAAAVTLVPFANHLPFTFQRTLSFLPLEFDQQALSDAQASSEWRYRMWHDLWPKVPQYLLLGKGYLLTAEDFQDMGRDSQFGERAAHLDASQEGLAISGDYHNGPLSVVIPFGIWGCLGYLWFALAAMRATYLNFKHGDPELKTVNTLLFVMAVNGVFQFLFIFGGFHNDVGGLGGIVGLSIALNGGVARLAARPVSNPLIKPAQPLPASQSA